MGVVRGDGAVEAFGVDSIFRGIEEVCVVESFLAHGRGGGVSVFGNGLALGERFSSGEGIGTFPSTGILLVQGCFCSKSSGSDFHRPGCGALVEPGSIDSGNRERCCFGHAFLWFGDHDIASFGELGDGKPVSTRGTDDGGDSVWDGVGCSVGGGGGFGGNAAYFVFRGDREMVVVSADGGICVVGGMCRGVEFGVVVVLVVAVGVDGAAEGACESDFVVGDWVSVVGGGCGSGMVCRFAICGREGV